MVIHGSCEGIGLLQPKMRKLTQMGRKHAISHESDHHQPNHLSMSSFGKATFELYIFDGGCSKVHDKWIFKTVKSP
jgi:hypothetical protein